MPIKLIKQISPEFVDERGEIFKLLDDGKTVIKSVLLITCKKGAIRANHYHKKDTHHVYLLSGSMEYTEAAVDGKGYKETVIVKKGDLVYTPSNVAHAMHFLEDSVFLTLSTESRHQDAYENDIVRVKVI
jgi:quercetin dioxygenase-like cupin family protein